MDVKVSGHGFFYDITTVAMLFFPGEKVNYVQKSSNPLRAVSALKPRGDKVISFTRIFREGKNYYSQITAHGSSDIKNLVKRTFYKACSKATGIVPPWGTLTGISPSSVYERLQREGADAGTLLKKEYYLEDSKIALLKAVSRNQQGIAVKNPRDVSVYISIPFCPGRCSYCSFISVSAAKGGKLLDDYLDLLRHEISQKALLIKKYGLNLRSVYVGGGTPGILDKVQLERLLEEVFSNFSVSGGCEICVELGRPDTVTEEKLSVLKRYGVGRICVNTQTTNDAVLAEIGRRHTAADYFRAVDLVKPFNFTVNTDLIAGLPGETVRSFRQSVDDVLKTGVQNVTVHTLAIKRSARLHEEGAFDPLGAGVSDMIDYAYQKLGENGYSPYYLYRQKNCVSNGENVGFCLEGTQCRYNIYMMEDVHSVISCGAGASSKIINGCKTERVINVKYPMEYVNENSKITANTQKIDKILRSEFCNG